MASAPAAFRVRVWQITSWGREPRWGRPLPEGIDVGYPPLDLPLRLILLYTNVDDIVRGPFMGSGSTAIAAKLTQRHYIGYEISPEYVELVNERIELFTSPQP